MGLVGKFMLMIALCGSAFGHSVDPVSLLIERQTNLTSEAGQRGDQTLVDHFAADEILFSAGDGTVQHDDKLDINNSLAAHLKTITICLHQTSRPAARFFERRAMFVDETGLLNRVSDFAGGAAILEDWIMHRKGDVAIASFTLKSSHGRFLVVEVWKRHPSRWRLAGGQAVPLYADPNIMSLSVDALETYAGTYSAGPGSSIEIQLADSGLTSVAPGGATKILKPEASDVFFTPGMPSGYPRFTTTFLHDHSGAIIGFSKNDILFRKVDRGSVPVGPDPVSGPLLLRDFKAYHQGDLVFATFFHDRDTDYYGQTLHQTFRSSEAWINDHGTWKMISSQGTQIQVRGAVAG